MNKQVPIILRTLFLSNSANVRNLIFPNVSDASDTAAISVVVLLDGGHHFSTTIFSGKLAPASVNVENAVMIGETMLEDYEKTWPEGFNSTISKKVETMVASCKSVKISGSKVYDLNAIYSRVIALLSSDRDVDVNDVFSYELAPVPTCPNCNVHEGWYADL
ncbi:hypothetical protein GQR58_001383 [Nymphon striatum]|nr:hypothetical protein GQR58_001383 [Nymphon striatum]